MRVKSRPPPSAATSSASPARPEEPPPAAAPRPGWLEQARAKPQRLLHDAAGVLNFLALKGTEVLAPKRFEQTDQQAIAQVADCIRRRDEPGLVAILEKAGPRLAEKLWEADLPTWVPPGKTLDTLKTGPDESWRVRWNYDFDTPKAAAELTRLAPPLEGLMGVLTHVRKNFPAGANTRADQLTGGTTFGYDPARPGSGQVTPNEIRMATSLNARTGQAMPIALMTYSKEPWFDRTTGVGFNDEFKALTPNVILAKGRVAEYTDADLHGAAAGRRPALSSLLSRLSGNERKGVSPQAVRFWMQRIKTDAAETPVPPG
ncbi:MAG: hypothetical protein Q8L48_10125 [Archangium sp.]|nr:hypothetical protein [Archangium sp.]